MWIDSHAHLTSSQLYPSLKEVVERAKRAGIESIVNICTDMESLSRGLELSAEHDWIFCTAATTPHDVTQEGESFFPHVERAAFQKQLIAIGESGLDFAYEHSPRALQLSFLIRYFELAFRAKLPLVLHCREAFEDLFITADEHYRHLPALIHCFTGNLEEAKGALDRGWYLSFSGIVTFKNAENLRAVARYVPLDRLLIETDSPYLAPQSHRGLTNEPAWVVEVGEQIAKIKNLSSREVALATKNNAHQFFSFFKDSCTV
jgi:TatD DNase family protein